MSPSRPLIGVRCKPPVYFRLPSPLLTQKEGVMEERKKEKSTIRRTQDWMNHYPRKILDGKSPLEALVDEFGAGIQIPKLWR